MRERGDRAVVHGLRGQESNRRINTKVRDKAVKILSAEVYRGFGPTPASEHLAKQHDIRVAAKHCGSGCRRRDCGKAGAGGQRIWSCMAASGFYTDKASLFQTT